MSLPRLTLTVLSLGVAGLCAAGAAQAGCGFIPTMPKPAAWNFPTQAPATLTPAVYWQASDAGFLPISDYGDRDDDGIVGMWLFTMVTPGPNGTPMLVDDGYAQWHSDHTEIQNSGLHAPKTSNFCLGVWQQTGPRTFKLNHFPLAWDPTGDNPANPIQLTMTVKLSDNEHFTGSFTLKVYNWDGTELTHASGAPIATIKGSVTAVRVNINSTVPGSQ